SLGTRTLSGFEALVRWEHPRRGLVSPDQFIPVAEDTGLIEPLGRWVLEEACRQMVEWQREHRQASPLDVSVNLSNKQFADEDLEGRVAKILADTGLQADRLKLEVTESAILENQDEAAKVLGRLKDHGVRVSLDDFGTGYSSFSYLCSLPYDTLKIDRSFVSRIGEEGENTDVIHAIIVLAHNLRMEVVAEGVENEIQAAQLKSMWCEYAQGFHFARPLPAAEASALIASSPQWGPPTSVLERALDGVQRTIEALARPLHEIAWAPPKLAEHDRVQHRVVLEPGERLGERGLEAEETVMSGHDAREPLEELGVVGIGALQRDEGGRLVEVLLQRPVGELQDVPHRGIATLEGFEDLPAQTVRSSAPVTGDHEGGDLGAEIAGGRGPDRARDRSGQAAGVERISDEGRGEAKGNQRRQGGTEDPDEELALAGWSVGDDVMAFVDRCGEQTRTRVPAAIRSRGRDDHAARHPMPMGER
ncbi:MAG: EAL domain-containing protein, partial [Polyangiaceae bacterium]